MPTIIVAQPAHEVALKDVLDLCGKHAAGVTSEEMLAIAANVVGKLIALQNRDTITKERAMEIVVRNIEVGNSQVLASISKVAGNA